MQWMKHCLKQWVEYRWKRGLPPRVNVISVAGGGDGDGGATVSPLLICA